MQGQVSAQVLGAHPVGGEKGHASNGSAGADDHIGPHRQGASPSACAPQDTARPATGGENALGPHPTVEASARLQGTRHIGDVHGLLGILGAAEGAGGTLLATVDVPVQWSMGVAQGFRAAGDHVA